MDEAQFWRVIDLVDRRWMNRDEFAAVEPLIDWLAGRPTAEIAGFEEQLARKLFALDGRRHMAQSGVASNSVDGFLYARCYVVARGEREFQRVRDDPARMPKLFDEWCEGLLSVASKAYERSTGAPADFTTSVSYETGSNREQWK